MFGKDKIVSNQKLSQQYSITIGACVDAWGMNEKKFDNSTENKPEDGYECIKKTFQN